jgi:hypothetical protein
VKKIASPRRAGYKDPVFLFSVEAHIGAALSDSNWEDTAISFLIEAESVVC